MNTRERHQLLAEKTELERMLAKVPESCIIDRMSLEARKAKVEEALEQTEDDTMTTPERELRSVYLGMVTYLDCSFADVARRARTTGILHTHDCQGWQRQDLDVERQELSTEDASKLALGALVIREEYREDRGDGGWRTVIEYRAERFPLELRLAEFLDMKDKA
jgi:hypothetical protein